MQFDHTTYKSRCVWSFPFMELPTFQVTLTYGGISGLAYLEPAWRTVASSVRRRSNGVLRLDNDRLMGHPLKEGALQETVMAPARIEAVLCCWSCIYFGRSNLYHGLAPLPMLRMAWLQHRPRTGTHPIRRLSQMPGQIPVRMLVWRCLTGMESSIAEYGVWQLSRYY